MSLFSLLVIILLLAQGNEVNASLQGSALLNLLGPQLELKLEELPFFSESKPWPGPWKYLGKDIEGRDVKMPMVGLGTWQYDSDRAYFATKLALMLGYRHVDTAYGYKNQEGVGKAIRESGVPRDQIFVTTKIPGGLLLNEATAALETNLRQLNLEYVDLVLLHFPSDEDLKGGASLRQEDWQALEKFYFLGKTKAVGVSHYCRRHIEDILEIAKIPIAVNQVQYHVGMGLSGPNATDDKGYMDETGIVYQSFSPLCGPCGNGHGELINGPLVSGIGQKYNKTGAQVSLKWLVQQGIPVIPKSDKKDHLLENLDLFDWELGAVDMLRLDSSTTPPVAGANDGTSGDCVIP